MQKVGDEEELQKNDNQGNIENEKSFLEASFGEI